MSTTPDLTSATWKKSTYSEGNSGQCLEGAPAYAPSGTIPIRDSGHPTTPTLLFPTPPGPRSSRPFRNNGTPASAAAPVPW
ncbi:DUF397 domain-containing protein [Streptomyces mobaraensis]|uniref:DUF397 domain-containing protein n=2 Tax=Streptomyces TaxID=1883 RepID=UPI001CD026D6|nr:MULTISPECIES: DUF397 domain-containing protein [Streptomyces]UBI39285.1 DUF397 domain-containing protein [Streptomyces mobaraensis]UKW31866.1 DUF397 domain-containing protein [Streptomyces sp. TYQ1024]